ncbi:MAG: hypothetical protein K9G76_02595 [Bacteroidales bacterium]|nr:hypothetical protein [Bacteroidales bacterium]MCF8404189.1 hypothetical protein [Bacteroidales bacterium]
MEDQIVTLSRYTYYHEYLIVKSKLESEGIDVVLRDDYSNTIDPMLSNATGGIKLEVRASQAKLALEILKTIALNKAEQEEEKEISIRNRIFVKSYGECPKCESEEVYSEKQTAFKSFFAGFIKREHYCKVCKHTWFQIIEK